MQFYTYECGPCGSFDLMRPMAQREAPALCPRCGSAGRRVFTAPHLGGLHRSVDRVATRAGRSAESPDVTSHVPGASVRAPAAQPPGYPSLPRQ